MSNISEINGQLINAATASLSLSASGSLTGSLLGTSSWAYSASQALTASFALNGGGGGITLIQAGTGIDVTNGSGPTVTISTTSTGGTNLGLVYAVSLGYLMP
jgi:hypothetical protein